MSQNTIFNAISKVVGYQLIVLDKVLDEVRLYQKEDMVQQGLVQNVNSVISILAPIFEVLNITVMLSGMTALDLINLIVSLKDAIRRVQTEILDPWFLNMEILINQFRGGKYTASALIQLGKGNNATQRAANDLSTMWKTWSTRMANSPIYGLVYVKNISQQSIDTMITRISEAIMMMSELAPTKLIVADDEMFIPSKNIPDNFTLTTTQTQLAADDVLAQAAIDTIGAVGSPIGFTLDQPDLKDWVYKVNNGIAAPAANSVRCFRNAEGGFMVGFGGKWFIDVNLLLQRFTIAGSPDNVYDVDIEFKLQHYGTIGALGLVAANASPKQAVRVNTITQNAPASSQDKDITLPGANGTAQDSVIVRTTHSIRGGQSVELRFKGAIADVVTVAGDYLLLAWKIIKVTGSYVNNDQINVRTLRWDGSVQTIGTNDTYGSNFTQNRMTRSPLSNLRSYLKSKHGDLFSSLLYSLNVLFMRDDWMNILAKYRRILGIPLPITNRTELSFITSPLNWWFVYPGEIRFAANIYQNFHTEIVNDLHNLRALLQNVESVGTVIVDKWLT